MPRGVVPSCRVCRQSHNFEKCKNLAKMRRYIRALEYDAENYRKDAIEADSVLANCDTLRAQLRPTVRLNAILIQALEDAQKKAA